MENATFSIWERETYLGPRDIVIVGGGLVGLWSARFLKQANPSLRIALLERGLLPSGASTRNAGFACFGSPGEIVGDMETMGRDEALELVAMRYRGLELMKQLVPASLTGYETTGGYECFGNGVAYTSVMSSLEALNRDLREITGVYPVFSAADSALGQLGLTGFDHLIFNPLEGALHSGRLVQTLTAMAQAQGVDCLTNTTVTGWETTGAGVSVHTDRGFSLRCGRLLVCTNGFAGQLLGGAADAASGAARTHVIPARGQILVTEPIPGLTLRGTFHYDEGFYYFRHLGDRILLGGARNQAFAEETTTEMQTTTKVQDALEAFLRQHVPQAAEVPIAYRWAGIMGMGAEKRPLLRAVSERVFCAVRLGGVGVAISPLVGQRVADLMEKGIS
jgi:glycine/D-amino acid oxidase-like deaminating enzyme